jgi:long-chain fatty acid transport protein
MNIHRGYLLGTAAACAVVAGAATASAGGFALREQSTSSQGASFAGNAASPDLSAMFWNPAAAANKNGTNSESNYSLVVPHADITITSATHPNNATLNGSIQSPSFGNSSGDIGSLALLGSSYFSHQFVNYDPNLFLAIAMNSPFGLKTDLDRNFENYKASVVGRETKLLTFNLNPTLAYRLSDSLSVGVGAQLQYGKGRFSFATGLPNGQDSRFDGTGLAVGATAGVMWKPVAGTTIGLGWRSQLSQDLDGAFINTPGTSAVGLRTVDAKATIELPNIVTLSLRQAVTSNTRVLGTVEWSQWSRLKELRVVSDGTSPSVLAGGVIIPTTTGNASTAGAVPGTVIGVLPANWSDGWFFALGGEYDVNKQLTVRAGGAYEVSPIDAPRKRLIGIPDNDRIWASLGATYKWSETLTFDLAYTHLFVKDSQLDRESLGGFHVQGTVDASTDIISVAMKTKW